MILSNSLKECIHHHIHLQLIKPVILSSIVFTILPFWQDGDGWNVVSVRNSRWRHQMKYFPRYCPLVPRIHVTGEFPAQRPVTQSFYVFLIGVWIHGWVNDREAGDLRRHRVHYDVNITTKLYCSFCSILSRWKMCGALKVTPFRWDGVCT